MVKKAHPLAITQGSDRILLSICFIWEWPETPIPQLRVVVLVEIYLLVPLNRSVLLFPSAECARVPLLCLSTVCLTHEMDVKEVQQRHGHSVERGKM
jgi:hypothetical protein